LYSFFSKAHKINLFTQSAQQQIKKVHYYTKRTFLEKTYLNWNMPSTGFCNPWVTIIYLSSVSIECLLLKRVPKGVLASFTLSQFVPIKTNIPISMSSTLLSSWQMLSTQPYELSKILVLNYRSAIFMLQLSSPSVCWKSHKYYLLSITVFHLQLH